MTYMPMRLKQRLYTPGLKSTLEGSDVYQPVREALGTFTGNDFLNRQLYADLCIYLSDDILVKVDRMSMATSLETRAPFLDPELIELVSSMPGHLKIRGNERKYVLKRAFRDVLPSTILRRPKDGFSIPMKNWLQVELSPMLQDLLSRDRLTRRGWFEPTVVQQLIQEHIGGRRNHAHTLFSLMVLERWAEAFLDGSTAHCGG